jgi:hypothetical protein
VPLLRYTPINGVRGDVGTADGWYAVDFQSVAPAIGADGAVAFTLVTEQASPCY